MPTLKIVVNNTFYARLLISSIVDISIYIRKYHLPLSPFFTIKYNIYFKILHIIYIYI